MADNDKQNAPGGPDFMARLRENINERVPEPKPGIRPPEDTPPEVQKFAPPRLREPADYGMSVSKHKNKTRNQTIAEFIIALPYREAMAMGEGIVSKIKDEDGGGRVSAEALTRAIQDWAWGWETFQDEERPGSKE
jgi:hypothetical protein